MSSPVADRIQKSVEISAPPARVWRAIIDPEEFAAWFGIAIDRPFAAGVRVRGTLVGSTVDAAVAQAQRPHAGVTFDLVVEQVQPGRRLAFRWHPGAVDPAVDYEREPMTLVEFVLEEIPGGTRVTVIESGFDALPSSRRAQAFTGNEQGWTIMTDVLRKHLSRGD
jgi:uncharacterized protein YndB with AHSA1/START domain